MPAESFNNFEVPVPSLRQQIEIVQYIDSKTSVIAKLIEKENIAIEKLKEYRHSLISEVVTGKTDVRDWHSPSIN
jgi:type I restriction enzyme S subunit